MKRILIFAIVGLVMFGAGFGGGLVLGRSMAPADTNEVGTNIKKDPGPMVSIGSFTSNLAGSGRHVIDCDLSLELIDKEGAPALIQSPGWMNKIRSEIYLLLGDRVYEDVVMSEGKLELLGDIKRLLNRMLPDVGGEAPIVEVLFDRVIFQ